MDIVKLKSWDQFFSYVKENNAKIDIDKNENLNVHLVTEKEFELAKNEIDSLADNYDKCKKTIIG